MRVSRKKLPKGPTCDLTVMWYQYELGKETIRYAGADGSSYELVEGDGWYLIIPRWG